MTRALLFDLGDVIVGLDFPRAYRAAARLTGRSVEEIPELIGQTGLASLYEHGRITSGEFHEQFSRAIGLNVSFDEFRALWGDMFETVPLLPESLFERLHRNYRMLLVSNTNELHFDWIAEHYSAVRHFDDYVLSCQVGSMKPDAAIFREAIRRAGCRPDECFFTDDKAVNIRAAVQLGIDAVQFSGAAALQDELTQRGVEWQAGEFSKGI